MTDRADLPPDDTLLLALIAALDSALARSVKAKGGFGPPDSEFGAYETADALAGAIAALPATSLAGVIAKASAFVRDYGSLPEARDIQSLDDRQAALVASILRDLVALT